MKVIKFGAIWCPGCLIMKPRWAEIEQENSWLKNDYYDFDTDKDAVKKYSITDKLPTFVFLDKNGNEIIRLSGETKKDKLIELINRYKDK